VTPWGEEEGMWRLVVTQSRRRGRRLAAIIARVRTNFSAKLRCYASAAPNHKPSRAVSREQ
jgi:hypothetical protein